MKIKQKKYQATWIGFFLIVFCFCGCDFIYRILQKEGAQEKDLIGVVVSNERNEKIEEAQKLLKLYGYKVGKIDGALGANTRKALGQFQKDNGLKQSHFIDNETWSQLKVFERYGLVIAGELNIYAIQVALKTAGIDPGKPDGKIGRKTLSAIKRFQEASGLKPDGKVGFRTLKALSQYLEIIKD